MSENPPTGRRGLTIWAAVAVPLLVIVLGAVALFVYEESIAGDRLSMLQMRYATVALWAWLTVGTFGVFMLAGHVTNSQPLGVLIDSRNKYSLSRLQLMAWNVLVLGAWLAIVIVRASSDLSTALIVDIPVEILAAMGLSIGSLVGATAIKGRKKHRTVKPSWVDEHTESINDMRDSIGELTTEWNGLKDDLDQSGTTQQDQAALRSKIARVKKQLESKHAHLEEMLEQQQTWSKWERDGLLARNATPGEATAADFFRGEEVTDKDTVDIGKVQMLYFTIVLLGAYGIQLYSAVTTNEAVFTAAEYTLPTLADTLITLLGISHAGYLTVKGIDSVPSTSQ